MLGIKILISVLLVLDVYTEFALSTRTIQFRNLSSPDQTEPNSGVSKVIIKLTRTGADLANATDTISLKFSGNATFGVDYAPTNGQCQVTFNPSDTEINYEINIKPDNQPETNEDIVITLGAPPPSNVTYGTNQEHKLIIKDDGNDVEFKCTAAPVLENSGSASVVVTREGAINQFADDIRCFTEDATAEQLSDFIPKSSILSFAKDDNSKTFTVTIIDDPAVEEDEALNVTCFSINTQRVRVDSSCQKLPVTILNDEATVSFCSGLKSSVLEDAGNYTVSLCREGFLSASHTVTLSWTSENNPTKAITAGTSSVVFAANDMTTSLSIPIVDDNKGETESKTFTIKLSTTDPNVRLDSNKVHTVTLQDNDNTFYFDPASTITANEDDGAVTVKIKRDGQISVPANVNLTVLFDGAATSSDCAGANPQNITFDGGKSEKMVTVCNIVDDDLVESQESFKIELAGVAPSNVRSGFSQRDVKIVSNDVDITCSRVSLEEGNGPAEMVISRNGATQLTYKITCSTSNNTAIEPSDYTKKTTEISFATNQPSGKFSIPITNDNIVEENETMTVSCTTSDVRVNLISCTNVSIDIINDDTYVYFCPSYPTVIREAGGPYTVALCRVGVVQEYHTVQLCWTSDANSQSHDFPSITAGCVNITFSPLQTRKEHNISIIDDVWGEQEYKEFTIKIKTNDNRITFNGTTSYNVTLQDEDNSFCAIKTFKVHEQTDDYLNVTIKRIGAITTTNASIRVKTKPGLASPVEDFVPFESNLMYSVNEVEKTIRIKIIDDKLVENEQPFEVLLIGDSGSTAIPQCQASTVTIVSNNVNIFCPQNSPGIQRAWEDQSPVLVVFKREGSIQYNHTIRVQSKSGTALPGSDFIAVDEILTFLPNQTHLYFNVTYRKDLAVEPDERFSLNILQTADKRVNVICSKIDFEIANDDTFVQCANSTVSVSENKKNVAIVLKREGLLNKASPIWYSTRDGTAIDKADYKPVIKRNATFQPGQVYMTLNFEIIDDDVHEEDEHFSVVVESRVPTTLTSSPCTTITVKDNDVDRITETQAQELLRKRNQNVIIFSVAIGFVLVLFIVVLVFLCIFYRALSKA